MEKEGKRGGKNEQRGKKLELWLFPAYQTDLEPNSLFLLLALQDKAELACYKFHQCKCEECGDECEEVFVPEEMA